MTSICINNGTGNFPVKCIKEVSCGDNYTLFLENSGSVLACGNNDKGQCSQADYSYNSQWNTPRYIKNIGNIGILKNIKSISACGKSSLFLENTGKVAVCGENLYGHLGQGSFNNSIFNVTYVKNINNTGDLLNIIQISGGQYHTLFLENTGKVLACGNNEFLQCGQSDSTQTTNWYLPRYVRNKSGSVGTELTNIIKVSAGFDFSLFLENTNNVLGCGERTNGQLGVSMDNTVSNDIKSTPAYVRNIKTLSGNLPNIVDISTGVDHALFLENTGMVLGCGNNTYGQIGYDDIDATSIATKDLWQYPRYIRDPDNLSIYLENIINFSASYHQSSFINKDGNIISCGLNDNGQAGFTDLTQTELWHTPRYMTFTTN